MTFTARMYSNLGNRIGIEPQSWREHAECRDADPEIFFPDKGFDYDRQVDLALEYCNRCPVTAECLEVGRFEKTGVWGGKPPRDRKPKRGLFDGFCEVCDDPIYRKSTRALIALLLEDVPTEGAQEEDSMKREDLRVIVAHISTSAGEGGEVSQGWSYRPVSDADLAELGYYKLDVDVDDIDELGEAVEWIEEMWLRLPPGREKRLALVLSVNARQVLAAFDGETT